jgi:hypothetical protein
MREIETTITFRLRAPGRQPARSDHYTVYYVPALRKVGMSAVLERRLRERGIAKHALRVLELVSRSKGLRYASERERFWCELLGCDAGTSYEEMIRKGNRSRRRRR